ncbi:hypothetical protein HY945_00145 [Candidatus Gottesmanbacteria bacterium]|nr:hypothetical protein [Candidatus Gottesmanbacteria bacterium]
MKKKIIFITIITVIAIIIFNVSPNTLSAASPTLSPSDTVSSPSSTIIDKLKKIELLKEKIATKVAEIRASEKAAVSGLVTKFDKSKLTVKARFGDITVTYMEDTIFYSFTDSGKTEGSAAKIKEDSQIAAFGYFDETKTNLSAKYVYLYQPSIHLIGKIADMDKGNYTITVKEPQGTTLVDIETYSKIYILTADKKLAKGGFSKLKIGDMAHIEGNPNSKEENRISSTRIISLSFAQPTPLFSPPPSPKSGDSESSSPSANQ